MESRLVRLVAVAAVVLLCHGGAETADEPFPGCRAPLGLSSGSIADRQISASSSSDTEDHAPWMARLNRLPRTSGWCSSAAKEKRAYLEVDLGANMRVSAVSSMGVMVKNATTGSFTHMFVSQFFLIYRRDGSNRSRHYRGDEMSVTVFKVNSSSQRPVARKHYLRSPRIARYLRFVAHDGVGDRWCLKVEVYGCPWHDQDGLEWYKMSQGNYRAEGLTPKGSPALRDISYDGHRLAYGTKIGVLTDGLGQLVDGQVGLPADWNNTRDSRWVNWIGWRDTLTDRPSVTFKFSSLRRFSALRIHVLNYPGVAEKMMFSKLVVSFSKDGEYYSWEVIFEPSIAKRRRMMGKAFWLRVDLQGNVGQYVTCEFLYQGWWTLISEVQFESSLLEGPSSPTSAAITAASTVPSSANPSAAFHHHTDVIINESARDKAAASWNPLMVSSIAVGGLVAVCALLVAVWLCKRRTRRTAEAMDNNALVSLRINNPGKKKDSLNRRNDPTAGKLGQSSTKAGKLKLQDMYDDDEDDDDVALYKLNSHKGGSELEEELLKDDPDSPKNLCSESRELSIEEEKAEVLAEMRRVDQFLA